MHKFLNYATAIALASAASVFVACSDDDDDKVRNYNLTLHFAPSAELAGASITNAQVILAKGGRADTIAVSDLSQPLTLNKTQGSYTVTFSAKLSDEAQAYVTGSAQAELYADKTLTLSLTKGRKSSLVFKTIYSTGGAQFYVLDSYIEIANNSDEVQYLDGLMLAAPMANLKAKSAWQTAFPDKYNSGQGAVLAFPGTGKDYPLKPGEFVVVADQAMNHKLAYGNDTDKAGEYAKSPDLSAAHWEKYYGNGDTDNEKVPNLKVVFTNNSRMKMWGFGVLGRAYILAKLPEGVTPEAFAADEANFSTTPGTTSTMQYLMIPAKYVLDAVELYNPATNPEENYPFFLDIDDAKGIQASAAYTGKAVRRKVEKLEDGRLYYKDTNNSSADFKNEQDNTPGITPTAVD